MITLLIFLAITLAESAYLYVLGQRVRDAGGMASDALGVRERYRSMTAWVVNTFTRFRKVLWIAGILVLVCNLIAASVLGFLIGLFV